jgi:hypothetical protein
MMRQRLLWNVCGLEIGVLASSVLNVTAGPVHRSRAVSRQWLRVQEMPNRIYPPKSSSEGYMNLDRVDRVEFVRQGRQERATLHVGGYETRLPSVADVRWLRDAVERDSGRWIQTTDPLDRARIPYIDINRVVRISFEKPGAMFWKEKPGQGLTVMGIVEDPATLARLKTSIGAKGS